MQASGFDFGTVSREHTSVGWEPLSSYETCLML